MYNKFMEKINKIYPSLLIEKLIPYFSPLKLKLIEFLYFLVNYFTIKDNLYLIIYFYLRSIFIMDKNILKSEEAEPPNRTSTFFSTVQKNDSETFIRLKTRYQKENFLYSESIKNFVKKDYFTINLQTKAFKKKYFPYVSEVEWNNWHWQLKNRIQTLSQLEKIIKLIDEERDAILRHKNSLPVVITPFYLSLIYDKDPNYPLRRIVIPILNEHITSPEEKDDPLSEDKDCVVPGLIHRYPDRVLFLVTDFCAANCRYCTRSRMIKPNDKYSFNIHQWEDAIQYIKKNFQIRDVLLSGGDPLTLSDSRLEWLLTRIKAIPHVEFIRIGTRIPVVLPQRITSNLLKTLKRYHPLWMSIHFTHPDELTEETNEACNRLADAGIPLGSQTVLLRNINDNVETMKKLFHGLLKIRVKPYYLYQCDPIIGSSHFRTSVEKGLEIIQFLKGYTSGYAVPNYVIDAPNGGGKIPLLPKYFLGKDQNNNIILKNYKGQYYKYPDCIDKKND